MHVQLFLHPRIPLAAVTIMLSGFAPSLSGLARQNDFVGLAEKSDQPFGIVVHGGAGTLERNRMTPEQEKAYHTVIAQALEAGYEILKNGGSSLDAVEEAVAILEDSPLINAGKGAVFNLAGRVELDASIMDGRTLEAGAVAAVKRVKNPIKLARLVMERTPHVMLSADGAEEFARENRVELVDEEYFHTTRRWEEFQRMKEAKEQKSREEGSLIIHGEEYWGTGGAVALDKNGNLAAATSTGGRTGKMVGRIGDSPIIGAGTYAKNATCAVSATGHGEYFIRGALAYDVSALMEYKGMTLQEAAENVIHKKLTGLGGTGGIIAIDNEGNIAMPFNTSGMYRGYIDKDGTMVVKIFKD